jgi:hypothetical protein
MKLNILIILFFIFCFLFSFDLTLAIGIGTKPSSLDLELKVGQPEETKILVYNLSQEAGIFQIFADELNEWIKIEPNSFRLEAEENRNVRITILAKEEGRKAINLSILATPLDRRSFSVGPGLKIPLKLNIKKEKLIFLASLSEVISQSWIWVTGTLLIILITGFFLVKYFKNRKATTRPPSPPENLPVRFN